MKEKLIALIPSMQQILEGLRTFDLLNVICSHPHIFKFVFCRSGEFLWDFEFVEEMLSSCFSEKGSNHHKMEIDSFKALVDGLENVFHSDGMYLLNCYDIGIVFYFKFFGWSRLRVRVRVRDI